MDFGSLPPEINSARMYAGPGSGPLLSAAEAWAQVAGELHAAAASYGSVIADLTSGSWAGPAATSMAAAAAPYLTWLNATAARAGQSAGQAGAAAAAFEAAFAATVPPPLIAANRSLLASLVATNLLGQNTPAIAATEAHYAEMWAQDAAAMYGYASASSAATNVTPFDPPPQTTEQAGLAAQAVAAQQPGTELQPVIAATPQALQGLSAPTGLATLAGSGSSEASSGSALSSMAGISSLMMPARMAMMPMSMLMRMFMMGGANGAAKATTGLAATSGGAGAAGTMLTIAGSSPAAAASMGAATPVGGLSVPTAWTGAGSASAPAAAALSATGTGAAPVGGAAAAMPPMMPITNMAARGGLGGSAAQYDFRPTVLAHSPIGG